LAADLDRLMLASAWRARAALAAPGQEQRSWTRRDRLGQLARSTAIRPTLDSFALRTSYNKLTGAHVETPAPTMWRPVLASALLIIPVLPSTR
jgi:hypothetical protein